MFLAASSVDLVFIHSYSKQRRFHSFDGVLSKLSLKCIKIHLYLFLPYFFKVYLDFQAKLAEIHSFIGICTETVSPSFLKAHIVGYDILSKRYRHTCTQ